MRTLSRPTKWLIASGAVLAIGTALVITGSHRLEPLLRERAEQALRQRFAGDVELKSFDVNLFPEVVASGGGLIIRHHGRLDVPPLISIEKFSIHTRLHDVFATPRRVRKLRLEGLRIFVPMGQSSPTPKNGAESSAFPFVVDEVTADGTLLQILPRTPGKKPITIDLHKLALRTE